MRTTKNFLSSLGAILLINKFPTSSIRAASCWHVKHCFALDGGGRRHTSTDTHIHTIHMRHVSRVSARKRSHSFEPLLLLLLLSKKFGDSIFRTVNTLPPRRRCRRRRRHPGISSLPASSVHNNIVKCILHKHVGVRSHARVLCT